MIKKLPDIRLIVGFLIAHVLMYFTFMDRSIFWYMFTATMLCLISYSILNEEIDDEQTFGTYFIYGVFSGLLLYVIFWTGYAIIDILNLPFLNSISSLYGRYAPSNIWQYIVLLFILVPGEEIFWRGFIQKRVMKYTTVTTAVFISSLLYASVNLYSGYWILAIAALVGGIFWGYLYAWKRSIPLLIVSHIVFDLVLFIIFPLI
ncbi:CPBP family intramembrane glutamic endopeptidase [Cytobacillus purgationiresistens]|uniref:Membrane protease YdiL (CAAX protease family) n=1 Tax=Cytobacillus purgationiresistens TaxID=863449 RepID=A0ABU0AHE6_9BACI|nr:CPBP family intramembrane glutamic endopeptidase [Cytobacillus purgationiresistens]MDQ0270684.1 membrane protease YdiL (CAAX protease family) [Cytobacillus purgationiresistens]